MSSRRRCSEVPSTTLWRSGITATLRETSPASSTTAVPLMRGSRKFSHCVTLTPKAQVSAARTADAGPLRMTRWRRST